MPERYKLKPWDTGLYLCLQLPSGNTGVKRVKGDGSCRLIVMSRQEPSPLTPGKSQKRTENILIRPVH